MDGDLIGKLREIIINAGQKAIDLRQKGLVVHHKADNSPVTNADVEVSNYIYGELLKIDPAVPIICEEQEIPAVVHADKIWLVDPIDGTKSFAKNQVSFTVNIALIDKKNPVIGFVYLPAFNKLYYTDASGQFCIDQDRQVVIPALKEEDYVALVGSRGVNKRTQQFIIDNNFTKVVSIASSIKLCMIAEQTGDVYAKFGATMEWDIAAGHALIKAAGGEILDYATRRPLQYCKRNFENPNFLAFNHRKYHQFI